jgi:MinD-like ATPase involved in chromosome partitioning or flagellar assembly
VTTTVLLGLKGGVGTTRLAVRVAQAARNAARTCVAVDLDRWHGNLALELGVDVATSIADLRAVQSVDAPATDADDMRPVDVGALAAVTYHAPGGCSVIASPADPELAELVDADLVASLVSTLAAHHDVVIDAGSKVDECVLRACQLAWRIVLVGRDTPACRRSALTLTDLLVRAGVAGTVQLALPREPLRAQRVAARWGMVAMPRVASGRNWLSRGAGSAAVRIPRMAGTGGAR